MNGNSANDPETDEAWEDVDAVDAVDAVLPDVEKEAAEWRRQQAELRRLLGIDDASGYHVVDEDIPDALDGDGAGDSGNGGDDSGNGDGGGGGRDGRPVRAPLPAGAVAAADVIAGEPDDHVQGRGAGRSFPCLEGGRYSGCLGMACPLETCWTGAATISVAHRMREGAHVSAALYLPGAPCHTCACLREDVAPARVPRGRRTSKRAERPLGADAEETPMGAGAAGEGTSASMRRITCARGLWAHPISLASFVAGRIPMRDQDAPEQCPGFVERPAPHPAVAAHRQRRRERTRHLREERRANDG